MINEQNGNIVEVESEKKVEYEVNGESVTLSRKTVKNYLTSGNGTVSDQEVTMFIQLCRYQHLNPFLNEAYLVKFGSNPAQIITSKEAFMKRAESHPQYNGLKAGCIVQRNQDIQYTNGAFTLPSDHVLGAWADVYRKDRNEPTHVEISMAEFSKGQATWRAMPATMIRKTAIVNALREAFPQDLGALYTEDDKNPNDVKQVSETKPEEPKINGSDVAETLAKQFVKPEKEAKPVEATEEETEDDASNENKESARNNPEPEKPAEAEQGELL